MLNYLICSTPRVGSNLLSSLIYGTRVLGHPREYFCPIQVSLYGPELCGLARVRNADELHRYLDAVAAKFSSQGRFGIKAHLHQLRRALELGYDFEGRFPDRFVHITRADVIGQAISHERAVQTGAWTAQVEETRRAEFLPDRIRSTVHSIVAENHAWEALFRRYDVEPYRLSYEALCADFDGELTKLLVYLDVDPSTVDVPAAVRSATSHFKTQRDAQSEDWRACYREWINQRARRSSRAARAFVRTASKGDPSAFSSASSEAGVSR
jgi:LPS sulfotransferase NodH